MAFNEQLRIQQADADEQIITMSPVRGAISVEVADGDENGTTIELTLSVTEAEALIAKLAVMVAQVRMMD